MKHIKLGEIFTESEIKRLTAMVSQGASAAAIAEAVICPVLGRINSDTGQDNDALYLAYSATYAIEQSLKHNLPTKETENV